MTIELTPDLISYVLLVYMYTIVLVDLQLSVLEKRHVNPGTGTFRSTGTCKKYWRTIDSGTASNRKIMKNMTYRVLDPGFTFLLA